MTLLQNIESAAILLMIIGSFNWLVTGVSNVAKLSNAGSIMPAPVPDLFSILILESTPDDTHLIVILQTVVYLIVGASATVFVAFRIMK